MAGHKKNPVQFGMGRKCNVQGLAEELLVCTYVNYNKLQHWLGYIEMHCVCWHAQNWLYSSICLPMDLHTCSSERSWDQPPRTHTNLSFLTACRNGWKQKNWALYKCSVSRPFVWRLYCFVHMVYFTLQMKLLYEKNALLILHLRMGSHWQ